MFSGHQTDELANLKDIHLPNSIGWWPLAPGWYVLALLLTVLLVFLVYLLRRRYLNNLPKRQALRLLMTYQQQYRTEANSQLTAARISELLKRVALSYFPREEVASLQGEEWITFLNKTVKGLDFNSVKKELLELPYQPNRKQDLSLIFKMAKQWVLQRRGRCLVIAQ